MRTFWNILAFIAVVNLLALLFGGMWLWWSGRLDERRLHAVSELFAMPTSEVQAMRAEAVAREQEEARLALEERRWGKIPTTNVYAIDEAERWDDLGRSLQGRLEQQAMALNSGINARLDERAASLEKRERILLKRETRLQERLDAMHDMDFKAMVVSLEELDEEDALAILLGYVEQGRESLVVTILAAVDSDVRTDLIEEFIKSNRAELAGRLLLELRDRGDEATIGMESLNASIPADANIAVAGSGAGRSGHASGGGGS